MNLFEGLKSKIGSFNLLSLSLLLAFYLSHILLVWSDYHFFQIDQWGHIASSVLFLEGNFHEYVDRFFLGYVQNLFYPPLQDALLSVLHVFTGQQLVNSYKTYLSLVLALYLFSFWRLSLEVKNLFLRSSLLICLIAFLFVRKAALTEFQGLGLTEFLITGLNNQILGMSFFLLMVAHLKRHCEPLYVASLCSLCILSHLIVGLSAGLLLFIYFLTARKDKAYIFISGLMALGLTCFFWLPFFWYREFLIPSSFYQLATWSFLIVSSFVLWLRPRALVRSLVFVAIIFTLPEIFNYIAVYFDTTLHLPNFHYSRLSVFALILNIIALFYALDRFVYKADFSLRKNRLRLFAFSIVPILLLLVHLNFENTFPFFKNKDVNQFSYHELQKTAERLQLEKDNRIWAWHIGRPIDNLIGSVMASKNPDLNFIKGLFWESSPNNGFITNYLVSLDGLPSVLDYSYYSARACPLYECLFESGLSEMGITHLIFPDDFRKMWSTRSFHPALKNRDKYQCLSSIIEKRETSDYRFQYIDQFRFLGEGHKIFEVVARSDKSKIKTLKTIQLKNLVAEKEYKSREWMIHLAESCQDQSLVSSIVMTDEETIWKIENLALEEAAPVGDTKFEKISSGKYVINLPEQTSQMFHVKLAYHPGFRLRNTDGSEAPLFESYPGMIGVGSGQMRLEYEKPIVFYAGYGLSFLSFIGLLVFGFFQRQKRKQSSAE